MNRLSAVYNLVFWHHIHRFSSVCPIPGGFVDEHICLELDGCPPISPLPDEWFRASGLTGAAVCRLKSRRLSPARRRCCADVFLTRDYWLTFTCKALCKLELGLLEMGSGERPADELRACLGQVCGRDRLWTEEEEREGKRGGGGLFVCRKKQVIEPRPISKRKSEVNSAG